MNTKSGGFLKKVTGDIHSQIHSNKKSYINIYLEKKSPTWSNVKFALLHFSTQLASQTVPQNVSFDPGIPIKPTHKGKHGRE